MSEFLSEAERDAYELLLDASPAGLAELSGRWDGTEDLAGLLSALDRTGMVSVLPGDPPRYRANPPQFVLDTVIAEQDAELDRAHDRLVRLAAHHDDLARADVVEKVVGGHEISLRLAQMQRDARHEVRCVDPPRHFDSTDTGRVVREALRAGVAYRCVYDRAWVSQDSALPEIEALMDAGQQARVLPGVPVRICLADDRLGLLQARYGADDGDGDSAIVVHPSALLDSLGKLFDRLWQRAVPLRLPAARARTGSRRTADLDSEQLVGLLLSGLTDEAIARHLGVGSRTVQRRVAALMAELGAHSRFQAGVLAAHRLERPRSSEKDAG